jgi:hypothetical protein
MKVTIPENFPWVRVPVKVDPVARKLGTIMNGAKTKDLCFDEEITEAKTKATRICLGFESL